MENFPYLFAAYTIVWLGVFGYVLALFRQGEALRRELESLKEHLKKEG